MLGFLAFEGSLRFFIYKEKKNNKNRRTLKAAVRPCRIDAFEEPNYERVLKGKRTL